MGSTHTHTKSEWEPLYIGSTHTHKIWMKALYIGSMKFEQKNKSFNTICWCKHNDNANNTKRNWIILLNFINLNREITQYYLDWGITLALFKEIQALGWLNFVACHLWLVSLHLPFAHVSSPISLIFNVKLNIFTNSSSSIFTLTFFHLCYNIYSF